MTPTPTLTLAPNERPVLNTYPPTQAQLQACLNWNENNLEHHHTEKDDVRYRKNIRYLKQQLLQFTTTGTKGT